MAGAPRKVDAQILLVLGFLGALAATAWWLGGLELVGRGLSGGAGLLWRFGILIVLSFLAAGLVEVLVPREWIRAGLGDGSGLRGVVLGTLAGAATPAGPAVSIPLAAVLLRSGAAIGPLVAFVTGWALLAVHRLVAWELPILGWRFALLRWGVSLALPILAGLVANSIARGLERP